MLSFDTGTQHSPWVVNSPSNERDAETMHHFTDKLACMHSYLYSVWWTKGATHVIFIANSYRVINMYKQQIDKHNWCTSCGRKKLHKEIGVFLHMYIYYWEFCNIHIHTFSIMSLASTLHVWGFCCHELILGQGHAEGPWRCKFLFGIA